MGTIPNGYKKKIKYNYSLWKSNHISISPGNSELGKIPNFNLAPIISCYNSKNCAQYCYALKSFCMYPSTSFAWMKNYLYCLNRLNIVEKELNIAIEKNNPLYFRFHSSGDLISRKHFNIYIRVVNNFPDIQFLMYSKAYKYIPDNALNLPDNFKVILSLWNNIKKPYHKKNYLFSYFEDKNNIDKRIIQDTNKFYCPKINNEDITCETCLVCYRKTLSKNVVFKKH